MSEKQTFWGKHVPKSSKQAQEAKPINKAWDKAKNNQVNIIEARNVPRVWNPAYADTNEKGEQDLERLIELPLRKAVKILWDKDIRTTYSDVWAAVNVSENNKAKIGIEKNYLSPVNLAILEDMKKQGFVNDIGEIFLEITPNTPVKIIEDFFAKQANKFVEQKRSDFTDEQIFSFFSGFLRIESTVLHLVTCSKEEYENLPATQALNKTMAELLFGEEYSDFINFVKQEKFSTKQLSEYLVSQNPDNPILEDLFYPRQDPNEIKTKFSEYKAYFLQE